MDVQEIKDNIWKAIEPILKEYQIKQSQLENAIAKLQNENENLKSQLEMVKESPVKPKIQSSLDFYQDNSVPVEFYSSPIDELELSPLGKMSSNVMEIVEIDDQVDRLPQRPANVEKFTVIDLEETAIMNSPEEEESEQKLQRKKQTDHKIPSMPTPVSLKKAENKNRMRGVLKSNLNKSKRANIQSSRPLKKLKNLEKSDSDKENLDKKVYNVDQLNSCISNETTVDITFNPLSGRKWILEDFRPNPQFNNDKNYVYQEVLRGHERRKLKGFDCEECKRFYSVAGYGIKMMGLAWDETQDAKVKSNCNHNRVSRSEIIEKSSRHKIKRSKSPLGFFKSGFPNTQELQQQKNQATLEHNQETLERYLTATSMDYNKRVFIFRNQIFNNIVNNGFFTYDDNILHQTYGGQGVPLAGACD